MARSRLEMKVNEDEKTSWPKEVSSDSQWRRDGEVAYGVENPGELEARELERLALLTWVCLSLMVAGLGVQRKALSQRRSL